MYECTQLVEGETLQYVVPSKVVRSHFQCGSPSCEREEEARFELSLAVSNLSVHHVLHTV